MLTPYRVLDLSDERGQLAGLMLAQLGAEVIAVEPPGGSSSRFLGPFAGDVVDVEGSLQHWAYNRGKSSVVLDLAGLDRDRESLRRLVAGADVLIESGAPGALGALGLGYEDLAELNPSLVYASITPFGQDGPKAQWAASDLTVWAAAGVLVLTGDSDRPPVRVPGGQAFIHAAAEAAGAIIAALYERGSSGLGQRVDVSAQQAAAQATQSYVLAAPNGSDLPTREAGGAMLGGRIPLQLRWPCADGYVSVSFLFGSSFGPMTRRLMQVVCEEGHCDESTRDKDWERYRELLVSGAESLEEYARVRACVGRFCAAYTKAELTELAMARALLIAPVNMMDDVVGLPHLESRDYWEDVDGTRYPGVFAKSSSSPLRQLGAAPRLGVDSEALLAELPRRPAAPAVLEPTATARPLEGLRVLDLTWVIAGPSTTRVLADLGATVVRVESARRIDTARTLGPFKGNEIDLETSCLFCNMNAGKLDVSVDLSRPEGRDIIRDLVRWADVVAESFAPKAMSAWGLDYRSLTEINPSLVMLSSCLFGQTGPLSGLAGFGTMAAAVAGFFGVTGWPDRAPCGPFNAYTDFISPRFATAVLLAALDHRRRTGEGQHIDFAQMEASLHAIAPAVLDYTVNGNVRQRTGNDDLCLRPHGVFPSKGHDRWIALACADDEQRHAVAALTGGVDDETIADWTGSHDGEHAVQILQRVGVAAHVVADSYDFECDPQLAHRGHLLTLPHPAMGEVVVEGPRFVLSRTPARLTSPGPTLGQHTTEVLTGLLGYDDEKVVGLVLADVLE